MTVVPFRQRHKPTYARLELATDCYGRPAAWFDGRPLDLPALVELLRRIGDFAGVWDRLDRHEAEP